MLNIPTVQLCRELLFEMIDVCLYPSNIGIFLRREDRLAMAECSERAEVSVLLSQ